MGRDTDKRYNQCPNPAYVYRKDNWYRPYECPYALNFGADGKGGCLANQEQCEE